jgi:hypothetical protein
MMAIFNPPTGVPRIAAFCRPSSAGEIHSPPFFFRRLVWKGSAARIENFCASWGNFVLVKLLGPLGLNREDETSNDWLCTRRAGASRAGDEDSLAAARAASPSHHADQFGL